MNELEKIKNKIGKWIEVKDELNEMTIEDFDYSTGVVGPITNKHCAKCVSVNKCWFVNEKEKKPEPFPIAQVKVIDNVINEMLVDLYHYKCHCQELDIISPCLEDIQLIIPQGKVDWLFFDKLDWIRAMGYENAEKFLSVMYNLLKKAYCDGDYQIIDHNRFGVKINLFVIIPGDGLKFGHSYPVKSAFMIFPNGKLKCNTILGGRQ